MDELDDLLRLSLVKGLGALTFRRLKARFGSPREILRASLSNLSEVPGVRPATAAAIQEARERDVTPIRRQAEQLGVRIIGPSSPDFPVALQNIFDPPIILYVRGTLLPADLLSVAIVGARRCSVYGQGQAERIAAGLAQRGFTVVSGLARGIDAAAHRGALRAHGRTIAVLACGLGRVYPAEHKELADRVVENGALISELPLSTPPHREAFPARNRLISGLALGVLVVEAARNSGSLITARHALEQGREVFALPGPVDNPLNRGAHALIQDGAKLVQDVNDIVSELGPLPLQTHEQGSDYPEEPRARVLNEREAAVFRRLSSEPKTIDDLVAEGGGQANVVASTLTILEAKGFVRRLAGNRFVRA